MNRMTTIFAYLHVKLVFVVQMLVNQPFNHISVDASIDFAFPTSPFVNPICIFHCMIWWYFYLIIFMWNHQNLKKNNI